MVVSELKPAQFVPEHIVYSVNACVAATVYGLQGGALRLTRTLRAIVRRNPGYYTSSDNRAERERITVEVAYEGWRPIRCTSEDGIIHFFAIRPLREDMTHQETKDFAEYVDLITRVLLRSGRLVSGGVQRVHVGIHESKGKGYFLSPVL